MPRSLADAVASRDNALNLLRLVLASLVVVGHTSTIFGFTPFPFDVAGLSVDGFFVISGYLIAGSRVRLGAGRYLWHRCLRIFPGLLVCLLVTALVIAPLAALLGGEPYGGLAAAAYVGHGLALVGQHYDLAGGPVGVPFPGVWNGSLWTLKYEFAAYLVIGALLAPTMVRRWAAPVLGALLVAVLATRVVLAGPLHVVDPLVLDGARLAGFFLVGSLLWAVRERVQLRAAGAVLAGLLVVAIVWTIGPTWTDVLLPAPLAYLLLWLGGVLPLRLGAVNDLSYGVYVYAFPVQQVLALVGLHRLGFAVSVTTAWLLTMALAAASWWLVEKPALRLARAGRRAADVRRPERVGDAGH